MDTMTDQLTTRDRQLTQLKLKIKKWEKEFCDTNDRKPNKRDIDSDNGIRYEYKKYWSLIRKSNNKNDVWSKSHNKNETHKDSQNSVSDRNVFNSLSKKMFDTYVKTTTTNDGKERTGDVMSFRKRLTQRLISIDSVKSVKSDEQKLNEITVSGDDNVTTGCPKLNPVLIRAKSIDESILRSISNEFKANNNKQNTDPKDKLDGYSQPMVDNSLIDDIINRIDNIDVISKSDKNVRIGGQTTQVIEPQSDSRSKDSLNFSDLHISSSHTRIKRKSDVFDFDDDFDDNTNEKTAKRKIYADLDTVKNKQQTTGYSVSPMNSSEENIDTNCRTNEKKTTKKFFTSNDRNKRMNVLTKITINSLIGIDNHIEVMSKDRHIKTTSITKIRTTTDKSTNNIDNQMSIESESSKEITKTKSKKLKTKKVETNFKRLNMKKKMFASRGYKKFNIRKYKRTKWKQTVYQNRNNCYKCGATGHWAKDCTDIDAPDADVFDDELKKLGVSKGIDDIQENIAIEPLISDMSDLKDESIHEVLMTMGHKEFRAHQEITINRILSGKSCLLISSTGSGKSLCYQLPAYLYWKYRKAITLVISPLISLMEDQLTTFPKCLKAVCIHSGLSPSQRQTAMNSLLSGESQVLLLSPEAITGGNTCVNLNSLPSIGFVCIDEAHCLSEWSNNFRPSYLQLYRVLKSKLKIKTFLALTATATKKTSLTIARTLGLDPDTDIIGTTLVPENLVLSVSRDSNKELALIDLLRSDRFNSLKSIIVYCTRREQTEKLATLIRISFQDIRQTNQKTGKSRIVWDAQAYHAGMTSDQRSRVQKRFIKGDLRVIVATIAFGMGINKANIRAIIHYNMPKSFENYLQEIGRAGRDGLEAHCHLFLDSDGSDLFELQRHIYANSTDRKCLRKLIEKVFKSCKCRSIANLESENADQTMDSVCVGHEIAFPIEPTVMELDLKEETISTLITYLELDFCRDKVHLLSPINSMCTLLCYGNGSEQMRALSKRCPIVGIALTLYQKSNSTQDIPSQMKFDLVEVCSMLGRPISAVRNELRQLEWQEVNGRKKRTNIRIMFSDLSFYLKSVGDLSEDKLNECLEYLYDFTQIQESLDVSKLRNVYLTFRQFSQNNCTNRINQNKSLQLKQQLNKYFNDDDIDSKLSSDAFSDENFRQMFSGTHVHDLEQARRDVRDLLSIHGIQTLGSARAIARILQGIASPRYPADVWGKCRRFWRADITINFNQLLKISNEELIRLK